MKKYNTRAIVLKSLKYKDTDRIYTLLSEDYGKISAIARGVRRITSRRSGNLDTLNLIKVKITETSGGYKSIDEVETINSYPDLKKDYEKSSRAYYMAELIHKSVEEDSNLDNVFQLLEVSLGMLDGSDLFPKIVIAHFELLLLKYLGYQVDLNKVKKLNPVLHDILVNIIDGDLTLVKADSVDRADVFIKSYIYQYLADKFTSLEIVL